MKFGGTSVQDAKCMDIALEISGRQLQRSPVVVLSAMAGMTDELIHCADIAAEGDYHSVERLLLAAQKRHFDAVLSCSGAIRERAEANIEALCTELLSFTRGLSLLRERSLRAIDAVQSYGERLSTTVFAARAEDRGIDAQLLDSREFIITDEEFTNASPLAESTDAKIRQIVKPRKGSLVITQGFIAATQEGVTTTLGRGGSDFTAAILARALGAEEVQIWTDVNGIMTSDPRIVEAARTVEKISYEEAAELAYFGARVIHPSTIQPAIDAAIPVLVKNTNDPEGIFSTIAKEDKSVGLRAIAGKPGITLINVASSRMLNAYGFLSRIFSIFERFKTPVDLIATSEVSVSVTIENPRFLDSIVDELEQIGTVSVEREKAIICLVGMDLWKDSSFISKVFENLRDTPVRMISLGSSDINLSLVVQQGHMANTMKTLHREFFSSG